MKNGVKYSLMGLKYMGLDLSGSPRNHVDLSLTEVKKLNNSFTEALEMYEKYLRTKEGLLLL